MSQRRKLGMSLNIPFVDDSSGVMANGVAIGRPATPPIIRITIPESEVYEPKAKKTEVKIQESEKKNEKDSGEEKPESSKEDNPTPGASETEKPEEESEEKQELKELNSELTVPLTKRHRRNSISLPAGLDALEIQKMVNQKHPNQSRTIGKRKIPKETINIDQGKTQANVKLKVFKMGKHKNRS